MATADRSHVDGVGPPARRSALVSEFQADALALEERATAPGIRWALFTIAALIVAGLVWSAVSRVDVIVTAPGRLVTDRGKLVVQPIETSVVRRVHVEEGQVVRPGELLVTLDPTFAKADEVASRGLLESLDLQVERLERELAGEPFDPADREADEAGVQMAIHDRRVSQYEFQLEALDAEIAELRARERTNQDEIDALEKQMEVVGQVVEMRRKLLAKEFGSRLQWLEARSRAIEMEAQLQRMRNEVAESEQRLARLFAGRRAFIDDWRRRAGEELLNARRERDRMQEQLRKLERRSSLVELTAPAAGVVLEIAERSIGSVVREAEPLITLVPVDVPLEVEIDLPPRDIGRVREGDAARLKLEALPFQKHGTMDATISVISEDTFESQGPRGQRLRTYRAKLEIVNQALDAVLEDFRLVPGMNVTAEIKTGKRTILSYLLYPVIRGLDESIREPD